MDLKEENKNMRNEINEIKNLLKLGKSNIQINNNNLSNADSNILENQKIASDLALSKSNKKVNNSKQIQVARQTKNSVMDKVPEPIKNSVLTTDPNHIQGIPDLLVLHRNHWAALECKRDSKAKHRPNQDYYVEKMNKMSFARFIFPENKKEVLHDLQSTFKS